MILQAIKRRMSRKVQKGLNQYTLPELRAMETFGKEELFDSIILVPMNELHESRFRCMKGILVRQCKIVGCVSGRSDVVHPNGIGNYGKYEPFDKRVRFKGVPYIGLSIDCLDKSGCIRLMLSGLFQMSDIVASDLIFYKVMEDDERRTW